MKTYHVGHLTDYRRDPKTNVFCCLCQRDIKGDVKHYIHMINNQPEILHPEDEDKYTPDDGGIGIHPIGPECAKRSGLSGAFRPTPATATKNETLLVSLNGLPLKGDANYQNVYIQFISKGE